MTKTKKEVKEETPTVDEPIVEEVPAVKTPVLVDIAELQAKKSKVSPINFVDNDKLVLEWYNSLTKGDAFTVEQAAEVLDISADEVQNSFVRLQKKVLPPTLGHIIE